MAIGVAVLGILAYVAFRFKFNFGVGATIATFHDVLAVLGIFYLMGREINLILVTALLTIAGYSLTDTVVVFDRIRENMKVRHKEPLESIMNASINEVLSRTIITSVTVLLTSGALFFFGGEVIHDFSPCYDNGSCYRHVFFNIHCKPHSIALGKEKDVCKEMNVCSVSFSAVTDTVQ